MDRSLFPENVEVRAPDLRFEAEQRAFQVLSRFRDYGQMGVTEGLKFTVNTAQPTTVDISAGRAYTPNGDLVELEGGATQVQLVDTTIPFGQFLGNLNYFCLEYSEAETFPGPDELTGEPRNRRAVRASTLRVFSSSAYEALTEERKRNIAVIGLVRGTGGADLQPFLHFYEFGHIEPVVGASIANAAIEVVHVSPEHADISLTPATYFRANDYGYNIVYGRLNIDPDTSTMTYEAGIPGGLSGTPFTEGAGPAVTYNLGHDQEITLQSSDARKEIVLRVNGAMLRHLIADFQETVPTTVMYRRLAPRGSASDREHRRHFALSPSPQDPHGVDFANRAVRALSFQTEQTDHNIPRYYDRVIVDQAQTDVQWIPISERGGNAITPGIREYMGGSSTQVGMMRTINAYLDDFGAWQKDMPNAPAIRETLLTSRTNVPIQRSIETTGPGDTTWNFVENWTSVAGNPDPFDRFIIGGLGEYAADQSGGNSKDLYVNGLIRAWEILVGGTDFVRLRPGAGTTDIQGGTIICDSIQATTITQTGGGVSPSTGTGSLAETVFDISFDMVIPPGPAAVFSVGTSPLPGETDFISEPDVSDFGTRNINGTNVTIALEPRTELGYEFRLLNLNTAISQTPCSVIVEAGGYSATCRALGANHFALEMKPAPTSQWFTVTSVSSGSRVLCRTIGDVTIPIRLVGLST